MSNTWKESQKSNSLEAKFLFESYSKLREFLDLVADINDAMNLHPNMSFGRDFASIIIYALADTLSDEERELSQRISQAYQSVTN
jgi:pterin-4a-carbinolamine dehydratase